MLRAPRAAKKRGPETLVTQKSPWRHILVNAYHTRQVHTYQLSGAQYYATLACFCAKRCTHALRWLWRAILALACCKRLHARKLVHVDR